MYTQVMCKYVFVHVFMKSIYIWAMYSILRICTYAIDMYMYAMYMYPMYMCYIYVYYDAVSVHVCYVHVCYVHVCYVHVCYVHVCYVYVCDWCYMYTRLLYVCIHMLSRIYKHVQKSFTFKDQLIIGKWNVREWTS